MATATTLDTVDTIATSGIGARIRGVIGSKIVASVGRMIDGIDTTITSTSTFSRAN
jgi:hypothetical protein